jgi:hypothetical protein
MNEKNLRYQQTWPAESSIALWLTPIATLLLWSAWAAEVPLLIRLAMGVIAALALLLAGAALIKTAVTVSSTGDLEIRKTLVGLPVTLIRLAAAGIIRVELESSRAVKPAGKRGSASAKAATPRFRIDIIHAQGKFFVVASTKGGTLKDQAAGLADALHCPMQRIGG